MPQPVLYAVLDGVATLTLNRPERRNATSWAMIRAATEAAEQAAADPSVRVVVLTGAGGDFSVGTDLKTADDSLRVVRRVSVDDDRSRLLAASRFPRVLADMPKPVIAAVRGGCAGAGMSLAMACDLRYAADTAVFNTAFTALGVSGDLGLPYHLTRLAGPAKARELMLLPEKLSAARAYEAGLLTEVVPAVRLDERIGEIAQRLAAMAPEGLAGAKRNLEAAIHQPWSSYLPDEVDRLIHTIRGDTFAAAKAGFAAPRTAPDE
ncbi:enoyl-CoA hydratase/isomerase family protein [Streptomyces sp. NPDC055078]